MTPEEAFSLIRGRLGARPSENTLNEYILQELNAAQEELSNMPMKPWFLRKTEALAYIADSYFLLPGDCRRISEEVPVIYASGADSISLLRRPYAELYEKYNSAGEPKYYDIVGEDGAQRLYVFPTVSTGTVTVTYNSVPANIESSSSAGNVWYENAGPLLAYRAGSVIANLYLGDTVRGPWFDKQAEIAFAALKHECVAHEMEDSYHSEPLLMRSGLEDTV